MCEAILLAATWISCLAGMGWLALAMEGHWSQVQGGAIPRSAVLRLRLLGALGLAMALALCLVADHPTMAALVWIMALAVAALCIALALTWRPRLLRLLLAAAGLISAGRPARRRS